MFAFAAAPSSPPSLQEPAAHPQPLPDCFSSPITQPRLVCLDLQIGPEQCQ